MAILDLSPDVWRDALGIRPGQGPDVLILEGTDPLDAAPAKAQALARANDEIFDVAPDLAKEESQTRAA